MKRVLVFGTMAIAAAAATGAGPGALGAMSPGEWRFRDEAGAMRRICLTDPGIIARINNIAATNCVHRVLAGDQRSTTIAYSCPGVGQGRTTIIVESPEQVRLQTQGMSNGQPFDASYTGTLIGRCG